ncbi:hypothetical protein SLEP1_g33012 [Rubroshorea leprosula]|uniref:Uncharacterized protein n=1 Tax=Rubroshorea leprosula TaxID=152421 RepID=A0AAV5KFC8_9ROSI|nr:hypothetical protein SLEP1_g33012 [Rubroshorea leprosula]
MFCYCEEEEDLFCCCCLVQWMKGKKVLLLYLMDEREAVSGFLPIGKERKVSSRCSIRCCCLFGATTLFDEGEAAIGRWRKATKMGRKRGLRRWWWRADVDLFCCCCYCSVRYFGAAFLFDEGEAAVWWRKARRMSCDGG